MCMSKNKIFTCQIQKKQKDLANMESKVSQHKERISAMIEHLKNVQQELSHTQVKKHFFLSSSLF